MSSLFQADHRDLFAMLREFFDPAMEESQYRIIEINRLREYKKFHFDINARVRAGIIHISPTEKITLQGSVLVGPFLCIDFSE